MLRADIDFFFFFIICFSVYRLADLKDFKKVNEIYAKCEYTSSVCRSFILSETESYIVKCLIHPIKCLLFTFFDFQVLKQLCVADFPAPAPARSTYQVAALPLDARIEIECIAAL